MIALSFYVSLVVSMVSAFDSFDNYHPVVGPETHEIFALKKDKTTRETEATIHVLREVRPLVHEVHVQLEESRGLESNLSLAEELLTTEIKKTKKLEVRRRLEGQRRHVRTTLVKTRKTNSQLTLRLRQILTLISNGKIGTVQLASKTLRDFVQTLKVTLKSLVDEAANVLTGVTKLLENMLVTGELIVSDMIKDVALQPFEFALNVLGDVREQ
ncbi:uncharacterized protein LOC135397568 [Ornithodoros turicata]|uniref:uncharacterized protein LOC135397568 n=1 Tax=Ornithodoros turicata TaxID=34597 RepID=UPI003139836B